MYQGFERAPFFTPLTSYTGLLVGSPTHLITHCVQKLSLSFALVLTRLNVWTAISWEMAHCRISLSSCNVPSPQAFHFVNMELRKCFACFKVSINEIVSICGKPQFEVPIPERALCLFRPGSLFGLCEYSLPLTAHYVGTGLFCLNVCVSFYFYFFFHIESEYVNAVKWL